MADIFEIVSKDAIKGLEKTNTNIIAINDSMKKLVDAIIKSNAELKKEGVSFKEVAAAQKESAKNAKQLTDEEKKLAAIQKQAKANTDRVIESKIRHQQETKKTTDRIKESIAAETRETGSINALRAANQKLTKIRNATSDATEKGRKKIELINKKLDENNAKIKQNSSALEKQKQEIGSYSQGIQNALGQMGMMPPVLGQMTAGMKGVASAAGTGTKAMRLLRIAVISTGIGALIIAVTALVTWFQKTVAGGEALVKILAPLKAIMQVITNRVAQLGEALFKLFSGDLTGAAATAKAAISGIGDELERQIALQRVLADLEISLKKDVGDLAIKWQQQKNAIAAARLAARDQTLSIDEQVAAQQRAIKITKELADSRADDMRRQIALMLANEQAGISSQDEINERKQKIAELLAIEGDRDRGLLRLVEYLKTLQNQQKKVNEEQEKANEMEKARSNEVLTLQKRTIDAQIAQTDILAVAQIASAESTNQKLALLASERTQNEIDEAKRAAEEKQQIRQGAIDLAVEAGNAIFEINGNMLEAESQRLQEQKAFELSIAGDNADERAKIENKYAKKEAELKTKQAKNEKKQAIFNILVNTAKAIAAASPIVPLMIFAGAMGALQLAVVASKPIPKFAKGTKSAPGGPLIAGDEGRELIKTKSGDLLMASQPTVMSGIKGATIYKNSETEAIMRGTKNIGSDSREIQAIVDGQKQIAKALENQPHYTFDTKKRTITERRGKHRQHYFNTKLYGINDN